MARARRRQVEDHPRSAVPLRKPGRKTRKGDGAAQPGTQPRWSSGGSRHVQAPGSGPSRGRARRVESATRVGPDLPCPYENQEGAGRSRSTGGWSGSFFLAHRSRQEWMHRVEACALSCPPFPAGIDTQGRSVCSFLPLVPARERGVGENGQTFKFPKLFSPRPRRARGQGVRAPAQPNLPVPCRQKRGAGRADTQVCPYRVGPFQGDGPFLAPRSHEGKRGWGEWANIQLQNLFPLARLRERGQGVRAPAQPNPRLPRGEGKNALHIGCAL